MALLSIALLGLALSACGSAGKDPGTRSQALANAANSRHGYLNDGDNDHVGDEYKDKTPDNNNDDDNDQPWDYKTGPDGNGRYHDGDDSGVLAYGHAAGRTETVAIAAVVKRYYAAAAAADSRTACAMLIPGLAARVPLEYGRSGPSYLHGGNTCQAVMSLLFAHFRGELASPVAVTDVRIDGAVAYALLGSSTMPASYVTVQREHGAWRVNELLGGHLS